MLEWLINSFIKAKGKPKEIIYYPPTVNVEKKFIFIHIPKNAGTSIIKGLNLIGSTHHTALELKELLGKNYASFFSFCIVRNPWDRFLSLYNYSRLEESYYHSALNPEKAIAGKHLDYDLLKNATLKECAYYLIEKKLKHHFETWIQWNPQHEWILDKEGNNMVNYIGRLEDLNYHLKIISKKIGIAIPGHKLNVSSDRIGYRQYYDEETRKIVGDYYKKDIELFGYKF